MINKKTIWYPVLVGVLAALNASMPAVSDPRIASVATFIAAVIGYVLQPTAAPDRPRRKVEQQCQ